MDGSLVFSKHQAHRFPNDGEVEERIALLRAGKDLPPLESSGGLVSRVLGKLFG
jgi:hypothetical protein